MKDIKDYLHLHLGCWCECSPPRTEIFHAQLQQIDVNGGCVVADLSVTRHTHARFIKPILRPLSDIAEEEKLHVAGLASYRWQRHFDSVSYVVNEDGCVKCSAGIGVPNIVKVTSDGVSYSNWDGRDEYYCPNQYEITRYLLSKGFDLFNLISEGLAVNNSTLKQ